MRAESIKDPLDQDAITEMMKLADDEKIVFEEE